MRRQVAKTISIVSLLAMLSVGSINVPAGGGVCSIPSCRPRSNLVASRVTQAPAQNTDDRVTAPSAQQSGSFSFPLLLAQWAMSFLNLA